MLRSDRPEMTSRSDHPGNPWVTEIQKAYRNSRVSNIENRGLDSEFAKLTYVQTCLDTDLIPQVLDGRFVAVFLTGNPGDGKTALLIRLGSLLAGQGATCLSSDPLHGWSYELQGRRFTAIFDASESQGTDSSNAALDRQLGDLTGASPPPRSLRSTTLVAINDGRLREFFLWNPRYEWLGHQVARLLEGAQTATDGRVLVVDLKERSVVGRTSAADDDTIFDRILDAFIREDKWACCSECPAGLQCSAKFNRDTLANPRSGKQVRTRLRELLRIIHFRRARHITVRDLRSVISYLIAGVATCEQVQRDAASGELPRGFHDRLYFMAAFNPASEAEDNLRDLELCDPAKVPLPRLERLLHYRRQLSPSDVLQELLLSFPSRAQQPLSGLSHAALDYAWYTAMKRWMYFEGDSTALAVHEPSLPTWEQMLPYRHRSGFKLAACLGRPDLALRDALCAAISCSDGIADPKTQRGSLCVLTSASDAEQLAVFKRFERSDFSCAPVMPPGSPFVEIIPNRLCFQYVSGEAALQIDLDLYEILMRLKEGYQADIPEQEPFLVDLRQFKNRLLNAPSNALVLMESGRQLYDVQQDGGIISFEKCEG